MRAEGNEGVRGAMAFRCCITAEKSIVRWNGALETGIVGLWRWSYDRVRYVLMNFAEKEMFWILFFTSYDGVALLSHYAALGMCYLVQHLKLNQISIA